MVVHQSEPRIATPILVDIFVIVLSVAVLVRAGLPDEVSAISEIARALAAGELKPTEAQSLSAIIETYRRTVETDDIARRVANSRRSKHEPIPQSSVEAGAVTSARPAAGLGCASARKRNGRRSHRAEPTRGKIGPFVAVLPEPCQTVEEWMTKHAPRDGGSDLRADGSPLPGVKPPSGRHRRDDGFWPNRRHSAASTARGFLQSIAARLPGKEDSDGTPTRHHDADTISLSTTAPTTPSITSCFRYLNGGRARIRTWDPLIKS